MPRPRDRYLADARKSAILKFAAGEFARRGYRGASYNRILKRAGISKGSAYHYFESKAQLFNTLIQSMWERWLTFVGPAPRSRNASQFWYACERLYERSLQFFREEPALAGLVRTLGTGEFSTAFMNLRIEMVEWGRAFLRHGQSIKAIRDDLPEALLLELMLRISDGIDMWCATNLHRYEPDEIGSLAKQFVGLFRSIAEPVPRDERARRLWNKARQT